MANRKACHESAKDCSRQHITPMMFVVTDTRQADPDCKVNCKGLQEVTKKLAAGPHKAGLEVQLHLCNKTHTHISIIINTLVDFTFWISPWLRIKSETKP